ncbi:aminoglycoside phosphotransferase/kinase family protein [Microlunatus ginsengisoli]|uniref:hypothetical protein n=1 Tax=Microlunatus ginsengisoli TaxID=363863 RepID=UPI0031D9011C
MAAADASDASSATPGLTDTERAVYGPASVEELREFLSVWAGDRLGSPIAEVLFRAGRIDVVWGVELADGRAVVIKIHRSPVDTDALKVTHEAQRVLAAAGFPSAAPLIEPDQHGGHVLTAEPLIVGRAPDGPDPASRLLLADGMAGHIHLLRDQVSIIRRAGPGPSWCRYQNGPWPIPHDTLVDFGATRPGYEWLDDFGQRGADQILHNRDANRVVVGHADWYAGNTAAARGQLVGTFDWELLAETEAVIAGFAASCYASSSTGSGGLSSPHEVAAFMRDYDIARGHPLSPREQRTAAAAAAWIAAFNARWQVGLIPHGISDEATIARARDLGEEFLALAW